MQLLKSICRLVQQSKSYSEFILKSKKWMWKWSTCFWYPHVFVLFLKVTLSLGVVWGQCNSLSCSWLNLCAGVQQTDWHPVVLISQNAPQSSHRRMRDDQPSFCRSSLPRISPAGRERRKWCGCLFIDVHFISNPSISLCLYRKWPCSAATAESKFKYAESHKQMLVMLFSLFQLSFLWIYNGFEENKQMTFGVSLIWIVESDAAQLFELC